jgi:aspartate ammonia-lyase
MKTASGVQFRIEHDLIGERKVPFLAYYGIQTARALENFPISGVPISHYPDLIRALAMIKLASARANHDLKVLPDNILPAIEAACNEIIDGQFHDQFQLDVFQGGAGTSTNMNANEVIANRALEHLGRKKGEYTQCDPHDHVNASQSTNDAYPSALHLAMALSNTRTISEMQLLVESFRRKAEEFRSILKMARTQLQDAVPMSLGQEFESWAASIADEVWALERIEKGLLEVNMGGTAIGTGLNAPDGFSDACVRHLASISGKSIRLAPNLIEATQDTQAFVLYASVLKSVAIKLSKICNDLRLLACGPRTGIGEIELPAKQAGSSIMPGKVNPVIPEVVNQVCFRVIGNDLVVTLAAEAGQLQLNAMEPVIAAAILESQELLMNACRTLRTNCVDGIKANEKVCRSHLESSIGVVTALNPVIGYEKSTELAGEALRTGRGIVELVREKRILTEDQLKAVLDPEKMIGARVEKSH